VCCRYGKNVGKSRYDSRAIALGMMHGERSWEDMSPIDEENDTCYRGRGISQSYTYSK